MSTATSNPLRLMPPEERPRERCLKHGPETLSLRECLALILSPGPPGLGALGLAQKLLDQTASGNAALDDARTAERAFFMQLESRGDPASQLLGEAHRARLLAVFELARRYHSFRAADSLSTEIPAGHRSRSPDQIAFSRIPPERLTDSREWLGFVPLLGARGVGAFCLVERGARTHVNVEPSELFARILSLRPRGIWLFHNHPSGQPEPSDDDLVLTRNVSRLCRQLSLECLGHGIIARHHVHWIPRLSLLDERPL